MNDCRHSRKTVVELIADMLLSGQSTDACEMLRLRSGNRGSLMRVRIPNGQPMIVKTRRVQNLKDRLKRALGASVPRYEFRVHRHISRAGLAVPRPLMLFDMVVPAQGDFEVIVMEDLGQTTNGLDFLKSLISNGKTSAAHDFDSKVIELTRQLLYANIVDVDHQLRNIAIDGADRVVRIDLECARRCAFGRIPDRQYGTMLGRLVCSHVYACQPQLESSERFATELIDVLQPSAKVLHHAGKRMRKNLEIQRRRTGIDSNLRLAW